MRKIFSMRKDVSFSEDEFSVWIKSIFLPKSESRGWANTHTVCLPVGQRLDEMISVWGRRIISMRKVFSTRTHNHCGRKTNVHCENTKDVFVSSRSLGATHTHSVVVRSSAHYVLARERVCSLSPCRWKCVKLLQPPAESVHHLFQPLADDLCQPLVDHLCQPLVDHLCQPLVWEKKKKNFSIIKCANLPPKGGQKSNLYNKKKTLTKNRLL